MIRIFTLLILISITSVNLNAFEKFYRQGTWEASLGIGYTSGKSLFDMESKLQDKLKSEEIPGKGSLNYHYELTTMRILLAGGYSITDDLIARIKMPIAFYTLDETYDKDSNNRFPVDTNNKILKRPSYSLTQLDYFSIGAAYQISKGRFFSSIMSELLIPPGFHKGIFNDPDYDFLSDGALQFIFGARAGIDLNGLKIGGQAEYHFRDEEFSNQLCATIEVALTTVEDTELRGYIKKISNMDSWNSDFLVNPRLTTVQEDILSLGFSFEMIVDKTFIGNFNYELPIAGKNTLNVGGFTIAITYLFY